MRGKPKPSKVVFIDDKVEKAFNELSDDDPLKLWILDAVAALRKNAFAGVQISHKLIPKEYKKKYGINNLWKYNLPRGWRLLYTVVGDRVEIITAIIEWFDHKQYERRMNY